MEGDLPGLYLQMEVLALFQSTPSAWRVTTTQDFREYITQFQSTPSAWRVTRGEPPFFIVADISIHTLRMEGDPRLLAQVFDLDISIHTLRMEGDPRWRVLQFRPINFNPHPPHGG